MSVSMAKVELSNDKTPYSPSQRQLFEFMPKDGTRIKSTDLALMKIKKFKWTVDNPYNAVSVHMRHLRKKINKNKEPFELMKSKARGPYSVEFWIERRVVSTERKRRPARA